MHLPLKEYQERTLETLTDYYQRCLHFKNSNTAFYDLTQCPYAALKDLHGMPYVCLRLPTGGGKTFVACHAVGITASELLKTGSPIVLWLTPSNAIRDQTLNALKNPEHPYRDAFRSAGHIVDIRTVGEALSLPPHILNTKTTIAVEQILGRGMRLPRAQRKKQESLNSAYAFVASRNFYDAASTLTDGLVQNGFEKQAAAELIRPADEHQSPQPFFEDMTAQKSEPAPAARGEVLKVPKLVVQRHPRYLDFEASRFLETPWRLSECDAELSEEEFPSEFNTGERGEIGISDEGKVEIQFLGALHQQMTFLAPDKGWDAIRLADWLDRTIKHLDILRRESLPFLQHLVKHLIEVRGISIEVLIHNKYALKDAAAAKIDSHRQTVHRGTYQNLLLPECETPVVVSPAHCFSFDPDRYPYNTRYTGGYQFQKHYYQHVGDLKADGEEFRCAQFIDMLPEVKYWVRNIERQPLLSFWLQTSTDKFYPDFVCLLSDGRYLVVESKGVHLWSADDAKEKREIGELWEARSSGKCLFIMPRGPDFDAIRAKIA